MPVNSGPIPGENFTADTKNFPWHKPPEFVDLDDALDMLSKKVSDWSVASSLLTMADIGIPLYKISQTLVMGGVSNGKWTLDLGLLIAGPLTRILELICIGFKIDYTTGIDDGEPEFVTGDFFKSLEELKNMKNSRNGFKPLNEGLAAIKSSAEDQEPVETAGAEEPTENVEKPITQSGFMAMKGIQ